MTKADLAREYRDKYGMEMATHKLARILYSENKLDFKDAEDARLNLRRIEGKARGTGTKKTHNGPEIRENNPYKLPESDERTWEPFIIKGAHKIGLLSDIHVPYHCNLTLTAAIDLFSKKGIDTLLINGDGIDFYQLSRFEKDHRKRSFAEELDIFAEVVLILKKELKCKIIFKLGNHEERYDSFLFRKAHELVGVPEFRFEEVIKKRIGQDVEIVGDKRIIYANELDIIHGHEFVQGIFSPVNVARGLQLRAKTNAIQGHNHQTSEHTETNLRGVIKTTWSMACCCELHPQFMPINRWNNGMAYVELDRNGIDFSVENYRTLKGKIL